MLKQIWVATVAAALLTTPAHAGEELLFGPVPDWVERHPLEPPPDAETSQPVRVLLLDSQTRMENGRQTRYSAFALQIQTPQGLSAGNLSIPWNPDTDELTIHRLAIHRNSAVIDVLESGQTFTTLRREQSLEQATLDGVLTANLFPEDLQVGDVLEVVTSLTSANPVFGEHDETIVGPLNAPIERAHVRLMWPERERMRVAATPGLPAMRRSKKDGFEIAQLALDQIEMVPPPNGAPLRFGFRGFVEASDFASWSDLAAHFAPIYAAASKIPAEGPLRTEIDRIREASENPVARAEAALKLVQGRVRYVALLMGQGGWLPADAALTWSRRFGDCKAKTALLVAILNELGIEAEPVFVNSTIGDALPERLPMIGAFDHVLVRIRIDGSEYWLDGTRTGDTSLARLQVPSFHWGLPALASGAELVRMMPAPLGDPTEDLLIHIDASKGVRVPAPATIELILRGDAAIGTNQVLSNFVGEMRDRTLREYWRDRFDFVEPDAVALSYDEAAGELRMTLEGMATLDWDGQWYETDETGVGYRADFTREPGPDRDAPFAVVYPYFERVRQTIVLPPNSGFTDESFSDVSEINETVAGIEYRRHASLDGGVFVIERIERSVAHEFAASDAPAFEKRLRELRDKRVFLRMPSNYRAPGADLAVVLEHEPDNAQGFIDQGLLLMNSGRYDEAVSRFERASEVEPGNAWAWANRGVSLAHLRRPAEAEEAFARAEAIDPENLVISNGRGILAEQSGDFAAAVAAYSKVLERDPDNGFAISRRAFAHMGANEVELALADATRALEVNSKNVSMYGMKAFALFRLGQREEAAATVDALLAAAPDDPSVPGLASRIYNDLGMTDRAQEVIGRVLAGEPTAAAYHNLSLGRAPSDIDGRLSDLDHALELDPDFAPALFDRASLHNAAGRYPEALADSEHALRVEPSWPEVNLMRANIFTKLGHAEDALAEADAVIAANPDEAWAHVAAGKIFSYYGRSEDAVAAIERAIGMEGQPAYYVDLSQVRDPADGVARMADLDEALRQWPRDATVLYAKASLLSEQEDHTASASVYSKLLEIQPGNGSVLNLRGIELWRSDRPVEAETDFAKAREMTFDAMTLNSLCYQKAIANVALERALEECEESLRLQPDTAATLDSRGAVLLRLGRYDEAIGDFDRALEKMPGLASTRYLRAVALSHSGELESAQSELETLRRESSRTVSSMERNGFLVAGQAAE